MPSSSPRAQARAVVPSPTTLSCPGRRPMKSSWEAPRSSRTGSRDAGLATELLTGGEGRAAGVSGGDGRGLAIAGRAP